MDYVALDFEASCLPRHGRSFPIEVGLAENGRTARSWLIRPVAAWAGWDWTDEAEGLHGITRERLIAEGQPAATVLAELAEAIGGRRAIADSHLDAEWMAVLAAGAGVRTTLRVGHVEEVIARFGATPAAVRAAVAGLDRRVFRRHRAGEDARWLAALIEALAIRRAGGTERPLFDWRPAGLHAVA